MLTAYLVCQLPQAFKVLAWSDQDGGAHQHAVIAITRAVRVVRQPTKLHSLRKVIADAAKTADAPKQPCSESIGWGTGSENFMRSFLLIQARKCIASVVPLPPLGLRLGTAIFVAFLGLPLVLRSTGTELQQKTIEAFEHYVRVSDARMDAELRPGGAFLWLDSLPESRRQRLYDRVRRGQLEIHQIKTQEEGRPIEVPGGLIHDWVGLSFAPGASLPQALSLLEDYTNAGRTFGPEVRRSQLLERSGDTFKVLLQFYKESPRRVSFNVLFEVHYQQIDATHAFSRASSIRVAELEHPEQPESAEFPVGQGHGYLWRLNDYWRLEEKDGGVYVQVEAVALSRDVPTMLAWFAHPLIRRVSRQTVANLLSATRRGLMNLAASPPM